jgi:poly-gamma-glutamate synthesis protein (capsule biosynthesis protein)
VSTEVTEPDPLDAFPTDTEDVGWRGRLQRRLRRERTHATRDAAIGVLVTALVLALVQADLGLPSPTPAIASQGDAAADAPWGDEGDAVFTASFVGDVMFGRHVERVTERRGYGSLFSQTTHLLRGDYVSANLEQVISADEELPEADKLIHLRSGPGALDAMVDAGFTTVSLANNHAMDHGIPGLADTIVALDAAGIAHAGAGVDLDDAVTIDLQEHGELTVATLSFTDVFVQGFIARSFQGGVLQAEPETMVPLIQRARQQADLVLVHLHFGEEYHLRADATQRDLAEVAALAGADVVIGSHPHVLLPVERIGDTLVLYSLGNFVFDQGWSRTRESAVARYRLREDGTAVVSFAPVYLREATPAPLTGPLATYRRERIFLRLRGDSLDWRREGGHLVTEIDHSHVLEGGS